MLRTIKLSVDPVYIDPGSTLKHTGTSYQVSTTPVFTGNLVLDLPNNAASLLSHTFDYNMVPGQPLYVRTRYHFNNGTMSSWSNIISLNNDQTGMKTSDTILSTPVVGATVDYTNNKQGDLLISAADMVVVTGAGTINAISWLVESTDGDILYELPKSPDIQNSLRLPLTVLRGREVAIVSVVTHTDTNAVSNPGRVVFAAKQTNLPYFVGKLYGALYHDASNSIDILSTVTTYTTFDVRILGADGMVVATYNNIPYNDPKFVTGPLTPGSLYNVEMRGFTSGGTPTPWLNIYSGTAYTFDPKRWSTGLTYNTTQFGFGGYIDFNGLSTQSLEADVDGVTYMAIPETNQLAAYKSLHGSLFPLGITHVMTGRTMSMIPSLTFKRLYNGGRLLDITETVAGVETCTFVQADYGQTSKLLTTRQVLNRADERFGTGRTGSVVVQGNLVYYIPGGIVDPLTGAALPLEMRVYNLTTNTIVDHIPLPTPATVTEHVALAEDANGTLYIYGGTGGAVKNALHNEVVHTTINNTIYAYASATRSWVAKLVVTRPNVDSYCYRLVSLKNGQLLILDATPNIVGSAARQSQVYDPVSNTVVATITNNPTLEHIGTSIALVDGDVVTMSSTPDLVETHTMLNTTTSTATVATTTVTGSKPVLDLVVAIGDVVYIRDPYPYNSITIQGTSPTNTGKLVWVKDTGAVTYMYNDLIVTRNKTLPPVPLGQTGPVYNKVVVVGDAILTIL